jgi:hypothetical protein
MLVTFSKGSLGRSSKYIMVVSDGTTAASNQAAYLTLRFQESQRRRTYHGKRQSYSESVLYAIYQKYILNKNKKTRGD